MRKGIDSDFFLAAISVEISTQREKVSTVESALGKKQGAKKPSHTHFTDGKLGESQREKEREIFPYLRIAGIALSLERLHRGEYGPGNGERCDDDFLEIYASL